MNMEWLNSTPDLTWLQLILISFIGNLCGSLLCTYIDRYEAKKNKKKYFKAYAAKAKFGSKTVKVTFKNVTGYASYKVQMKAGKAAYKTVKTTTKGGTITYTKKKAKVGTTYKFRLKGINKVNGKTVSVTIK